MPVFARPIDVSEARETLEWTEKFVMGYSPPFVDDGTVWTNQRSSAISSG